MTCEEFHALVLGPAHKPISKTTVAERAAVLRHLRDCEGCYEKLEQVFLEVLPRLSTGKILSAALGAIALNLHDSRDPEFREAAGEPK